MSAANPQTIFEELQATALAIERSMSRMLEEHDPQVVGLLDANKALMKVDAHAGSLLNAYVWHLTGNWAQTEYWLKNARALGTSRILDESMVYMPGNLGFYTVAASNFPALCKIENGYLSSVVLHGPFSCAFSCAAEGYKALELANLEPRDPEWEEFTMNAIAVLARHHVSEHQVQEMLDLAGEVMRRHRLWFLGSRPVARAIDNADHSGLLYQLPIAVSPQRAAELTDEVIVSLVERDLDLSGVSFSFIGMGEPESTRRPSLKRIR